MNVPKTITFDRFQIENIGIFTKEPEWRLAINVSLVSNNDGVLGKNVVFQLDEEQQLQARKFLQPYIQDVCNALDIQEVINYEDPEEEVTAPEEEEIIEPPPE